MGDVFNKKFTSFAEMRSEIGNEKFANPLTVCSPIRCDFQLIKKSIPSIITRIQFASCSKDFFDETCRLAALLENLTEQELAAVFSETNLYTLVLEAVFRNNNFQKELIFLTRENDLLVDASAKEKNFSNKIFLNSGLSLAFFTIALGVEHLKENSITFLREKITSLVKLSVKKSNYEIKFSSACFLLERVNWDNSYHYTNDPVVKFPVQIIGDIFYATLRTARSMAGIALLSLTINASLGDQLKKITDKIDGETFSISKALNNLYGFVYKIEESAESYYKKAPKEKVGVVKFFFEIYIKNNEKNSLFFIKKVCSDFQFKPDKKFAEIIIEKIQTASRLKKELVDFAQVNLQAFHGQIRDCDIDWSNKIFIISVKSLSLLVELDQAKDVKWRISTAIFELTEWVKDVHAVFNRYLMEDDWALISEFVKQENESVEWKSTFFTPTEQKVGNAAADESLGKKLLDKIIKTILGMLNTDGGVIIVGLVENPSAIVRDEVSRNLISKNGRTFFDVNSELSEKGRSLDNIRLQIIDNLKSLTGLSADRFNNILTLEPILLRTKEKMVTVVKITINKSEKIIPNIKKEGGVVWAALVKRAQGQTIDVDLREYL